MYEASNTSEAVQPNTAIGEVIEQLHDHRIRADEPARLAFCPSGAAEILSVHGALRIDAD